MDDNRRQLVSLALVPLLLLGGYFVYTKYFDRPAAGSHPPTAAHGAPTKNDGAARLQAEQARQALARTLRIETDEFTVRLSTLNTAVTSVRLKGARWIEEGHPLELVTTNKEAYLPFRMELGGVHIPEDAVWEGEQISEREVRFTWSGDGFTVVRKIEAGRSPYQLWSTVRVTNESRGTRPVRLTFGTYHYVARDDEGSGFLSTQSYKTSHGVCLHEGSIERVDRKDGATRAHGYGPDVAFSAVENRYFVSAIATDVAGAERCRVNASDRGGTPDDPAGSLFASLLVYPRAELAPGATNVTRTMLFMGPKSGEALAAAGHHLVKVVDRGWFSIIAEYLVLALRQVHEWVGNWGLAIILLTIAVRIALFPLTLRSFQSMGRMRALKPEIDALNEKFGEDREAKGAAMMELYKKNKINPLGGCLPQLLQLPVWFAFYASLSSNVELYHSSFFGFWTDLSAPDPYFVLPIILGLLMVVQQKLTPSTMDPVQAKIMMYMMPIMITSFMLFLPAGLCLYSATNSLLGIAQQQLISRQVAKPKAAPANGPTTDDGELASAPSGAKADIVKAHAKRRVRRG